MRVPLRHTLTVLYDWDSKKNDFLKANRGISFEAIIVHLGRGDIWKVSDHPDQLRHPGQSILFVIVDDYVHMVPFEIRGDMACDCDPQQKSNKRIQEGETE